MKRYLSQFHLERVTQDYEAYKSVCTSHQLLQDLFSNTQENISNRYTDPLVYSIENYLKPLFSKRKSVDLKFDRLNGFSELKIHRKTGYYDFDYLSEGMKEKQIYDYLKDRYGEWILYDPEFNKNTYFLWLLPILMFIIGGAIVFKLFIIKKN